MCVLIPPRPYPIQPLFQMFTPRMLVAGLLLTAALPGHADQAVTPAAGAASEPALLSVPEKMQPDVQPESPYARFDRLQEQGQLISAPPIGETVLRDAGGFRSDMADHGIGFTVISLNNAAYDLRGARNGRNGTQYYNGQTLTSNGTEQLVLTYNYDQHGVDQRQIIFGVVNSWASWAPLGPRSEATLSKLAYYQSFENKKWELKVGYLGNSLEYLGVATGGSMAGGTQGPNAIIPYNLGLSRLPMAAPGINVTYNHPNGFYNRLGVQRSTSPEGAQAEVDENSHGLRFKTPGSGILLIDEVGLRRKAAPGQDYQWFRLGLMHNSSNYEQYDSTEHSDDNYGVYLAYDKQFSTQTRRLYPAQGWHWGATFNYAPQDRNLYTQYYEARLYDIGPFPSRPADMFSVVASRTEFSDDAQKATRDAGGYANSSSSALTVSYMTHLYHGVFLTTGLGYTKHPSFTPDLSSPLNVLVSLNMFF